jgi:large subunit ribosomal protein L29
MDYSVIKELTTDEILGKLEDESAEISKLKMTHAVSQLENPMVIRQKRRTIARLKTELRKRELEATNNK